MKNDTMHLIRKIILSIFICIFTLSYLSIGSNLLYGVNNFKTNIPVFYTVEEPMWKTKCEDVFNNYLSRIEEEGYIISNKNLDISRLKITKDIKEQLSYILDVNVILTKTMINDEVYIFKNNVDNENFLNRLNENIEQQYTKEELELEYKEARNIITNSDKLESKIEAVKQEAEEIRIKAEEEKRRELENQRLASRSREMRRTSNGAFPIATYSYISTYFNGYHTGVDYAAPCNTQIYAWKNGTITFAGWDSSGYGNFVIIAHDDGSVSRYAHLNSFACSSGERVSAGQLIGYVGTTGNSTGYHLHFEILVNGGFVNPLSYL